MPKDLLISARKNRIVVLEDLDFVWDDPDLKELKKLWKQGVGVVEMAEHFDRDSDEVLLALIHLARDDKIVGRESGLKGE